MQQITVGIVGATGAVGVEILRLLKKRNFPVKALHCFGSSRSAGTKLHFGNDEIIVEELSDSFFPSLDLVFFSAGSAVSKKYIPLVLQTGATVIDNSSAFRLDENVPLIIPEVNLDALQSDPRLIANPNCATIIMLMALAPLHKLAKIKRIVVATYQAASGAGHRAMEDLRLETKAHLQGSSYERSVIPHPYAFNLFLHNSPLGENGYVDEELKLLQETRKILNDPSIRVAATCVRVPVLRSHAEAINAEFYHPICAKEAHTILQNSPGIEILEDYTQNRFPMPSDATGQESVFCGRIRKDLSQENTLDLWVVGDQLLKGAALNAIQIAEALYANKTSAFTNLV